MTNHPRAGVTAPKGFFAGVAAAGIKSGNTKPDVTLVASLTPAVTAGVFTTNLIKAEPLLWSRSVVKGGKNVRAVLINAGNANACTGEHGKWVVESSVAAVAEALNCLSREVLVMSTGVIGVPLPAERLVAAVPFAATHLGPSAEHANAAARAIMTTDKKSKECQEEVKVGERTYTLGGMAKGSGMIHPNMATMLSVLTTDAPLNRAQAQRMLKAAVDASFNTITVDGDTSTNDCVFFLANGMAGGEVAEGSEAEALLQAALMRMCQSLAEMIAADGEGAQKLIVVKVRGAKNESAARKIARTIAASPLVKTAVHGGDPNWGRVIAAAGRAGVPLEPNELDLWIGGHLVAQDGIAHPAGEVGAAEHLQLNRVELLLSVGEGTAEAVAMGCDLTAGYVSENANYRS